jgi:hypothetical protein
MPVVDPVAESVEAFGLPSGAPRTLDARVRDEPEPLTWGRSRRRADCLVIDYKGEGLTAQTWVERETGLVLRQVAALGADELVMNRD